MTVSPAVWIVTLVIIVGLLAFDYFFHVRKAHTPTLRESAIWSAVYVGVAVLFGIVVWVLGGSAMGTEYFAGYITEKALSVDNLFVFLIIMTSFRVPRADQQKVLLFGVIFSRSSRGPASSSSAPTLINRFAWVFYLFGIVLLMTAGNMLRPEGEDSHSADNIVIRIARKLFKTSPDYDGDKLFTVVGGRRVMTPCCSSWWRSAAPTCCSPSTPSRRSSA